MPKSQLDQNALVNNQYCPRCFTKLLIFLEKPVILRCPKCEDRFVIPHDVMHDNDKILEEIKIQHAAHEIFMTGGFDE